MQLKRQKPSRLLAGLQKLLKDANKTAETAEPLILVWEEGRGTATFYESSFVAIQALSQRKLHMLTTTSVKKILGGNKAAPNPTPPKLRRSDPRGHLPIAISRV